MRSEKLHQEFLRFANLGSKCGEKIMDEPDFFNWINQQRIAEGCELINTSTYRAIVCRHVETSCSPQDRKVLERIRRRIERFSHRKWGFQVVLGCLYRKESVPLFVPDHPDSAAPEGYEIFAQAYRRIISLGHINAKLLPLGNRNVTDLSKDMHHRVLLMHGGDPNLEISFVAYPTDYFFRQGLAVYRNESFVRMTNNDPCKEFKFLICKTAGPAILDHVNRSTPGQVIFSGRCYIPSIDMYSVSFAMPYGGVLFNWGFLVKDRKELVPMEESYLFSSLYSCSEAGSSSSCSDVASCISEADDHSSYKPSGEPPTPEQNPSAEIVHVDLPPLRAMESPRNDFASSLSEQATLDFDCAPLGGGYQGGVLGFEGTDAPPFFAERDAVEAHDKSFLISTKEPLFMGGDDGLVQGEQHGVVPGEQHGVVPGEQHGLVQSHVTPMVLGDDDGFPVLVDEKIPMDNSCLTPMLLEQRELAADFFEPNADNPNQVHTKASPTKERRHDYSFGSHSQQHMVGSYSEQTCVDSPSPQDSTIAHHMLKGVPCNIRNLCEATRVPRPSGSQLEMHGVYQAHPDLMALRKRPRDHQSFTMNQHQHVHDLGKRNRIVPLPKSLRNRQLDSHPEHTHAFLADVAPAKSKGARGTKDAEQPQQGDLLDTLFEDVVDAGPQSLPRSSTNDWSDVFPD